MTFVDSAKIMAKGQITIPKDIRDILGVSVGSRVLFIVDGNNISIVNPAIYAMEKLQEGMKGAAEKAGITSDDDVMELVKSVRHGDDEE